MKNWKSVKSTDPVKARAMATLKAQSYCRKVTSVEISADGTMVRGNCMNPSGPTSMTGLVEAPLRTTTPLERLATKVAPAAKLTDREVARLNEAGKEMRDIRALCELIANETTERMGDIWRGDDLRSIRERLLDIATGPRYSTTGSETEARILTMAIARKVVR